MTSNNLNKMNSDIDQLLFECGITADDLKNAVVDIPKPVERPVDNKPKRGRPSHSKIGVNGLTVQKYVLMTDKNVFPTKESKMYLVLQKMIAATSAKFLLDMKEIGWICIDYSRQYKESLGGPVVLVGDKFDAASGKDKKCGRDRYGEINGKFPLYNLIMALKMKYDTLKYTYEVEVLDQESETEP